MNGVILAKKTDRELERLYKVEKKEFEKKSMEWDMEMRLALKERRKPDKDLKPEEPQRQTLISTPNSSKSQMIINIRNEGEDGLVIVASEGDVMIVIPHPHVAIILTGTPDQVVSLIQTTEKVGLYPNAAKRALKKYVANGLLSKNNGIYKKTSTMKKRDI